VGTTKPTIPYPSTICNRRLSSTWP
jgi:hypothetical protein